MSTRPSGDTCSIILSTKSDLKPRWIRIAARSFGGRRWFAVLRFFIGAVATGMRLLFVPEGFDRIHGSSASGRVHSEQKSDP